MTITTPSSTTAIAMGASKRRGLRAAIGAPDDTRESGGLDRSRERPGRRAQALRLGPRGLGGVGPGGLARCGDAARRGDEPAGRPERERRGEVLHPPAL